MQTQIYQQPKTTNEVNKCALLCFVRLRQGNRPIVYVCCAFLYCLPVTFPSTSVINVCDFIGCKNWCASKSESWKTKCMWGELCAGCSECSGECVIYVLSNGMLKSTQDSGVPNCRDVAHAHTDTDTDTVTSAFTIVAAPTSTTRAG